MLNTCNTREITSQNSAELFNPVLSIVKAIPSCLKKRIAKLMYIKLYFSRLYIYVFKFLLFCQRAKVNILLKSNENETSQINFSQDV